jgi:hypothetical protein
MALHHQKISFGSEFGSISFLLWLKIFIVIFFSVLGDLEFEVGAPTSSTSRRVDVLRLADVKGAS